MIKPKKYLCVYDHAFQHLISENIHLCSAYYIFSSILQIVFNCLLSHMLTCFGNTTDSFQEIRNMKRNTFDKLLKSRIDNNCPTLFNKQAGTKRRWTSLHRNWNVSIFVATYKIGYHRKRKYVCCEKPNVSYMWEFSL